jgi:quinone-modifying oxidoreductase, subunit QmoC
MTKRPKWDKIKYEAELDPHFAEKIAAFPGGEKIFNCIQCGTCSGMCPLSSYMDYTPRQIVAMIRGGFKQEVLTSRTTWLCASCYACTVECPKEVKITDVMYATKRMAIKEGLYPKRFPIPILARAFYNAVERTGRSNEMPVIIELYMKTKPWQIFKMTGLGIRLFLQGRMGLKMESIKKKDELKKLLSVFEKEPIPARPKNGSVSKREVA